MEFQASRNSKNQTSHKGQTCLHHDSHPWLCPYPREMTYLQLKHLLFLPLFWERKGGSGRIAVIPILQNCKAIGYHGQYLYPSCINILVQR